MKFFLVLMTTLVGAYGQSGFTGPGLGMSPFGMQGAGFNQPGLGMNGGSGNSNLNTAQGIMNFLYMNGINPSQLVTSNCIGNGNPCAAGGMSCCLSPMFSCQNAMAGKKMCLVAPSMVNNIPQIKQMLKTVGVPTPNPVL